MYLKCVPWWSTLLLLPTIYHLPSTISRSLEVEIEAPVASSYSYKVIVRISGDGSDHGDHPTAVLNLSRKR